MAEWPQQPRLIAGLVIEVEVEVAFPVQGQGQGGGPLRVFREELHSSTTYAHAHATHRAMNEPRAVLAHTDHDTAHSPKRKKVRRQKYAPKACMSIPMRVPQ
jgi:hypothetical protein